MKNTVSAALAYLAECCDGASSGDGQGFARPDTVVGRSLAAQRANWTERDHLAAKRLCYRYRRQLAAAGFNVLALLDETFVSPKGVPATAPAAFPANVPSNRYVGNCCGCGKRVLAFAGVAGRVDGKAAVRCNLTCGLPTVAEPVLVAARVKFPEGGPVISNMRLRLAKNGQLVLEKE